jgi:hypothetical protein
MKCRKYNLPNIQGPKSESKRKTHHAPKSNNQINLMSNILKEMQNSKEKENYRLLRFPPPRSSVELLGDPETTLRKRETQLFFPSTTSEISLVKRSTISCPGSPTPPPKLIAPLALLLGNKFPYRSRGRPSLSNLSGRISISEEEGDGEREGL